MIKSLFEYSDHLSKALDNVEANKVERAIELIVEAYVTSGTIYSCGNGGSAAISNHLVCDCVKGVACDTNFFPKIVSLNCNDSMMTAVANDIGFEHVFSKQLSWSAAQDDLLIAISSSGNSPNIINALKMAKEIGMKSIAILGFDGGKAKELADVAIHIPSGNYGIVEDVSQAIMHFIAQNIRARHTYLDPEDLKY